MREIKIDKDIKIDKVGPGEILFSTKGCPNLLRFSANGTIFYKGKILGTDLEILTALRETFFAMRRENNLCSNCLKEGNNG